MLLSRLGLELEYWKKNKFFGFYKHISTSSMAEYAQEEYYNMILAFGAANENAPRAVQIYAERFPDERLPGVGVFHNLRQRLLFGTGNLVPQHNRGNHVNNNRHYTPEQEELVLDMFDDDPRLSTRVAATRLFLHNNHEVVHKILKDNGRHPYHLLKVQDLVGPRDYQNRLNFCQTMRLWDVNDPGIFNRILWTDECTFTPNGMFNSRNYVHWHDFNPHLIRISKTQFRWSLNVWAGMIGPYLVNREIIKRIWKKIFYLRISQLYLQD